MPDGAGIIGQMGLKALASWAATWVAVDTYLGFTSESLTANHNCIDDDSLEGYGGRNPSLQGNQVIQGDTEHIWDYAADQLIPACMGVSGGGVITIADILSAAAVNRYWGIEFIKGGAANHRFFPAMLTKFTLSGEKDGVVKLVCSWAARQFTSIAAAAFTKPTVQHRVKFDQLVFRIGDQVNALVGGDEIHPDSFEISFDRVMKTDDYAADATLPQQALEPKENGFRVCMLKITLPRYAGDTIRIWKENDTPLQADLTFTGPGTATKLIQLPELRITEGLDASVGGPEVLTLEGTLQAFRGGTAFMYTGNEMKITYTT